MELNIMSFNVGIWTRNRKKSDPFYWKTRMIGMKAMLQDRNPDVICFQELWFPATLYIPKGYKKIFGTGLEHPIYVKKGLKYSIGIFSIFWSMAKVEGIRIFSVHGRWNTKITERLCNNLKKIYAQDLRPAILAGDWNVEYEDLYKQTQLLTSARVEKGLERKDTYIHFYDNTRHGELDHILLYRSIVNNYKIIKDYALTPKGRVVRMSDHYPILVEIWY